MAASHVVRAGFSQTRDFRFDVSLSSTPITFRQPRVGLAVTGGDAARLYTPLPGDAAYPVDAASYFGTEGAAAANARPSVADVNGDSVPDTVFVTGPGEVLRVWVVSGQDNETILVPRFDPFGDNFIGGGFVATGTWTGTGGARSS